MGNPVEAVKAVRWTLHPFAANHGQTYRGSRRALLVEDFQRAETAKPVPPPSRTPITGVNQRTWAEESNSRRGKPRSKPLCRGDASVGERKVFIGHMRDPAKPVPPPSRAPITGVAVKRARESNGRRGKPRSQCRFHLPSVSANKIVEESFEHRFRLEHFLASFQASDPSERLEGL
ncbi:hypothetical protein THAOC_03865 [Thalassiosira oceanica]|uniref:Uncharacterized protein n=1 Tax=Thalassiosira oceanica TaxID=159749 RepID=K0T6M4_THAOC|nr:hypothetical protein THAOC_03865 [Thalassiosira oceanica]|eukprot:EJK74453.1 hypothetical protein THAOC_03865 [Thalassiosira oceanica]